MHIEESIISVKDAIKTLLISTLSPGSDSLFDHSIEGDERDIGPFIALNILYWTSTTAMQSGDPERDISSGQEVMVESHVDDPIQYRILNFCLNNLKLHKLNNLQHMHDLKCLTKEIQDVRIDQLRSFNDRVLVVLMQQINARLKNEDALSAKVKCLDVRDEKEHCPHSAQSSCSDCYASIASAHFYICSHSF